MTQTLGFTYLRHGLPARPCGYVHHLTAPTLNNLTLNNLTIHTRPQPQHVNGHINEIMKYTVNNMDLVCNISWHGPLAFHAL